MFGVQLYCAIAIAFHILVLIYFSRRVDLVTSPAYIFVAYNFLSVISVPIITSAIDFYGVLPFTAMPYRVLEEGLAPSLLVVCGFSMFASIVVVANSNRKKSGAQVASLNLWRISAQQLARRTSLPILIFSIVVFLLAVFHFIDFDKSKLLNYSRYLEIVNPEGAGLSSVLTVFTHKIILYVAAVSIPLSVISLVRRRRLPAFLLLSVALYGYILALAFDSRWAVIFCIALGVSFSFRNRRLQLLPLLIGAGAAILSFAIVLKGRSSGVYGLEHTFDNLSFESGASVGLLIAGVLSNLSDGVFNIAAAFVFAPEPHDAYRWFSLVPLPSFIDGFSSVRQSVQLRISIYNPYGSYSEAILFGGWFTAIYFTLMGVFLIFAQQVAIGQKNALDRIFVSLPVVAILIFSYQYPMRTYFRFAVLGIVVLAMLKLARRKGNRST